MTSPIENPVQAVQEFADRHDVETVARAISETADVLRGETTREEVADELDIKKVEGVRITLAIQHLLTDGGEDDEEDEEPHQMQEDIRQAAEQLNEGESVSKEEMISGLREVTADNECDESS